MNFTDVILEIDQRFDAAGIDHAFGGALALAFIVDPRGTVDVDVNVFLPPEELPAVVEVLAPMGYQARSNDGPPIAGFRVESDVNPFPVDLFPSLDERYDGVRQRVQRHEFGPDGTPLPFLSAEDLVVFKLSFGRPKDWVDIGAIVAVRPVDLDLVEAQLLGLRGPSMNPRMARLRAMVVRTRSGPGV